MPPLSKNRSPSAIARLGVDANVVLDAARALQLAAQAGTTQRLLRGKKLGLLCDRGDDAESQLFRQAATELGAHVAHIRPTLTERSSEAEVRDTARMLGRLYDAVDCHGIPPALVEQLEADAGVPVYASIASDSHPSAALAATMGSAAAPADNRRFILQAMLLATIL